MQDIDTALAECKTIEALEAAHQERDREVQRLRAEQGRIHDALEPLWAEQQRLSAGPVNLRQVLSGIGGKAN